MTRKCQGCASDLPAQTGPGRPRKWCDECRARRVRVVKQPPERACGYCSGPIASEDPRAKWCSEHCRKRAHDAEIIGHCTDCGAGIARYVARRGKTGRCRACYAAGQRRYTEARASIIADLWEDGLTISEIADAFDWTPNQAGVVIARLRASNPEMFPYRRSERDVKSISAGIGRNLTRGAAA